ncbi:cation-translocating P-type ATPase [Flavilitoribacter nigricans]|uniref:ATPase n=1 Tax=Flavilitoribacter nigricans (strain ATCC 23147 / DSM 23189 / NBRC 102662 / NCIMB 1420 / SS-2) TaxID=1122177 RepID=A0A2D0NI82_FLAN2|nr:cation-transporting P-type ATPase [Flavilitoribacter nigricans]PHN08214.1 ATPase [Flavilitoribacter nigricans DSM 23189 = NBRC 102662]
MNTAPAKISTVKEIYALPLAAYLMTASDVVHSLEVSIDTGLTTEEAKSRLEQVGPNELELYRQKSLLQLFLEQFKSPLAWVLALASALAFGFGEDLEAIAILVVILINAIIGFAMEWQAMSSMEALRQLTQTFARVYRNGKLVEVETAGLVPGDVVYLEAGDIPAADMRLLETVNLGVNESALTGESVAVSKQIEPIAATTVLGDQRNMLFRGTVVSRGNARAVVVRTGSRTEIGKIADLAQRASKEVTPLEKKLSKLSQKLIWLALALALMILVIGLLQGRDIFLMIEMAIALAIAAVPEGLPVVATIALARGMLRLARQQVIVKKLSAVETLGETQVIITDKTGTLTENQLLPDVMGFEFGTAGVHFQGEQLVLDDPADRYLLQTYAHSQLQHVAVLCNNASLDEHPSGPGTGDPLEIALLKMVAGSDTAPAAIRDAYSRIREIPFDSERKMMGTLHKNGRRPDYLVCIKGAMEILLRESDYILTVDGKIPLSETQRRAWMDKADTLAAKGLRVLGFGYSEIPVPKADFFENIVFIGFVGFLDPPRQTVKSAIDRCKAAGVQVVMATGDHPETAKNIGLKTGLIGFAESPVIKGPDIKPPAELSEREKQRLLSARIFARVNPAQKLHLVDLFQQEGFIVGMTGDGVNDAPALKKADIGIAMGSRGTEAAKEASDLVLKDDQFASITEAIRQGRGIFTNIRHFVIYLISCNLSELLIVAGAYLSNLALPLFPLQILFMNMVTDVFPALALGMNRVDDGVMERPPRGKGEPIITPHAWRAIIEYALALTVATIGAFLWAIYYLQLGDAPANNFAFYTIIIAQLWHVFNLPDPHQSFWRNAITRNPYVWMALAGSILIMLLAYWIAPLQAALHLVPFRMEWLGWVLLFSITPVMMVRIARLLRL